MRLTSLIITGIVTSVMLVACSGKKEAETAAKPKSTQINSEETKQSDTHNHQETKTNPLGKCVKVAKADYEALNLEEDSAGINKLVVKFKKTGNEGVTINMGADVIMSFGLKAGEMTQFDVGGDKIYLKAIEDSRVELQKTGNITCK